jgi:DNA-directed RNA polymerase subunit N (RpoN/RPB10)
MIIPVRCLSCNKVLADKFAYYEEKCKEIDASDLTEEQKTARKDLKEMDKKTRGKVLDDLGLTRICCRRMMLSTVDMMDLI